MTDIERLRIEEQRIADNAAAASEFIKNIAEIRDKELYRPQFSTFEEYCFERWGIDAQQLKDVEQLVNSMDPFGTN